MRAYVCSPRQGNRHLPQQRLLTDTDTVLHYYLLL
jgi:hypothetical protein